MKNNRNKKTSLNLEQHGPAPGPYIVTENVSSIFSYLIWQIILDSIFWQQKTKNTTFFWLVWPMSKNGNMSGWEQGSQRLVPLNRQKHIFQSRKNCISILFHSSSLEHSTSNKNFYNIDNDQSMNAMKQLFKIVDWSTVQIFLFGLEILFNLFSSFNLTIAKQTTTKKQVQPKF